MRPIVDVNNLSFEINQKHILRDVSLQVIPGQFIGIIGPNGSGKTTLLNCLSGLIPQINGSVLLNDCSIRDYATMDIARLIAYLHQETPEDLNLNVAQVVELGLIPRLSLFGSISQTERDEVSKAIAVVGLSANTCAPFETLSGGEKQRCLLAKVIVQKPQILLMDEPTNHLDINYQVEIMSLVKSLGITVVASFHDLNLAAAYCDELLCLDDGEIKCQGTPDHVLRSDILEQIFKVPVEVDINPLNQKQRISFNYRSHHDAAG